MTPAPLYHLDAFHDKHSAYALIIGVYNEGEKFTRQLDALQPCRAVADIIIADGASDDGASDACAVSGKARALITNRDAQRGLSVQYRQALAYACEQGYAGVIMMDGNGKDGVDAVPRFIEKLEQGYHFIQGSRFIRGGIHQNTPVLRVLGIRFLFNPLMRLATGYAYTDAMNGFKACSRAFLLDPRLQLFRPVFLRYSLQYYLNYRAPRLKTRIIEIPVSRIYAKGAQPHSKIVGYRAYLNILKELCYTITGRYNPD